MLSSWTILGVSPDLVIDSKYPLINQYPERRTSDFASCTVLKVEALMKHCKTSVNFKRYLYWFKSNSLYAALKFLLLEWYCVVRKHYCETCVSSDGSSPLMIFFPSWLHVGQRQWNASTFSWMRLQVIQRCTRYHFKSGNRFFIKIDFPAKPYDISVTWTWSMLSVAG